MRLAKEIVGLYHGAEAAQAAEVQQQYIGAANTIFTLVRDRLGV